MLLLFSGSCVSDSLRPHELQHTRLPCHSVSPRACSNSCPLSQWCHPTICPLLSPSLPAFNLSQHLGLCHPLGVAITKQINKCLWGCGEIENFGIAGENVKWYSWWSFKKLNVELPYNPAIPLLGIVNTHESRKSGTWTGTCIPVFIATLFTVTRRWKQSKWWR